MVSQKKRKKKKKRKPVARNVNTTRFDIIYNIVKPSYLEKLQSYQMEINYCSKSSSYFLIEF